MLRVKNVSKAFGSLQVLQNVSLTVKPGERIAIIGPSGCGKSVFLRLLELLEQPDSGQIYIDEEEITAKGAAVDKIRQRIGMVYQGFHLFEHLDVLTNITLAPIRLRKIPPQQAEKNALELLRMVGLESKCHAMPSVLSGGQKQRIAICRCLAMEPKIMLFDEPTSALDPTMVGEVLATIRMLAKSGMTMLIVTHEMEFARQVATRVIYFDQGGIYEENTPTELFDNPQKPKTQAFIRKLKYFEQHINCHNFDLMQLHGGIHQFSQRYGLTDKYANRLELCTEELIYELLGGALNPTEPVDMCVTIEYSEAEKSAVLQVSCVGKEYNPFNNQEDLELHLGVKILKNTAKEIQVSYVDGNNHIIIKI